MMKNFVPRGRTVSTDTAPTPLQNATPTGLQLNTVAFLKDVLARMDKSYNYAYPDGYLDKDRSHAALSKLGSEIEVLKAFIKNLG